jgi:hypothetical protein
MNTIIPQKFPIKRVDAFLFERRMKDSKVALPRSSQAYPHETASQNILRLPNRASNAKLTFGSQDKRRRTAINWLASSGPTIKPQALAGNTATPPVPYHTTTRKPETDQSTRSSFFPSNGAVQLPEAEASAPFLPHRRCPPPPRHPAGVRGACVK